MLFISHFIAVNFIGNYSDIGESMNKYFEYNAFIVIFGMLLGLIITVLSFGYHFWKGQEKS